MDNWQDWYSNVDLYEVVINDLESICGNRLQRFIDNVKEIYKDDEDYYVLLDAIEELDILNESILKGTNDYVYIIDMFENYGIFQPSKERFIKCIQRFENWSKIKY